MGIKGLIQLATILAFLAASSGKLPTILHQIRVRQLHLIKESEASKGGAAFTSITSITLLVEAKYAPDLKLSLLLANWCSRMHSIVVRPTTWLTHVSHL